MCKMRRMGNKSNNSNNNNNNNMIISIINNNDSSEQQGTWTVRIVFVTWYNNDSDEPWLLMKGKNEQS